MFEYRGFVHCIFTPNAEFWTFGCIKNFSISSADLKHLSWHAFFVLKARSHIRDARRYDIARRKYTIRVCMLPRDVTRL
jgi:hypothetical protein